MQNVIVKTYKGSQTTAAEAFRRDADSMAKSGYFPTSQNYAQGSYGCGSFLLALILCVLIVGFIVFIYMLIVKPDGVLTVIYEYKQPTEKQCPRCAEIIKYEAQTCRFCGYRF